MSNLSHHTKYLSLWILVIIANFDSMGQSSRDHLKSGNTEYRNGNFTESETSYRKSLESAEAEESYRGRYNLGNSLYRLKKSEEAIQEYKNAIALTQDPAQKSKNFHNMGNTYMNMDQYQEAVNSYKQALRLNPKDEDTRYNLAYAQSKLIQQQQQQNQSKDNKQDEKNKQEKGDKNDNKQQDQQKKEGKDKGNDDQSENNEDNRDGEGNDPQRDEKQKSDGSQPKRGMSKEEAERMLKALQNDEADLQKQMKRIEGKSIKTDKQW